MSSALNAAIVGRLNGTEVLTGAALTVQQQLVALLGVDPQTSKPAVRWMDTKRMIGGASTIYPVICLRQSGGSPDRRFGADTGIIGNPLYDIEIWSNSRDDRVITDIYDKVEQLLDRRRQVVDCPALSSGKLFWGEAFTELAVVPDPNINAWCGLVRWLFVEARY